MKISVSSQELRSAQSEVVCLPLVRQSGEGGREGETGREGGRGRGREGERRGKGREEG